MEADGDCQDARQQFPITESLVEVTYETNRECRVGTGRCCAPCQGHHLGNPSSIDADCTVPRKNAYNSGNWRWGAATKGKYANYLSVPAHLVAISARHNRGKGARGPDEWRPPSQEHWCR